MPVTDLQSWPKIEVPQFLSTQDFARLLQVSVRQAQREFRRVPTIMLGKRIRRMSYTTFLKFFGNKELIHH